MIYELFLRIKSIEFYTQVVSCFKLYCVLFSAQKSIKIKSNCNGNERRGKRRKDFNNK
jgi:hypothetical protein